MEIQLVLVERCISYLKGRESRSHGDVREGGDFGVSKWRMRLKRGKGMSGVKHDSPTYRSSIPMFVRLVPLGTTRQERTTRSTGFYRGRVHTHHTFSHPHHTFSRFLFSIFTLDLERIVQSIISSTFSYIELL